MIDCAAGRGTLPDWERSMSQFQHDARTPLNVVLGFAQLLESEPLSPDQRESVDAIRDAGQQLLALLEALAPSAGMELADMETADLELAGADWPGAGSSVAREADAPGAGGGMVRTAGLEPARHEASEF